MKKKPPIRRNEGISVGDCDCCSVVHWRPHSSGTWSVLGCGVVEMMGRGSCADWNVHRFHRPDSRRDRPGRARGSEIGDGDCLFFRPAVGPAKNPSVIDPESDKNKAVIKKSWNSKSKKKWMKRTKPALLSSRSRRTRSWSSCFRLSSRAAAFRASSSSRSFTWKCWKKSSCTRPIRSNYKTEERPTIALSINQSISQSMIKGINQSIHDQSINQSIAWSIDRIDQSIYDQSINQSTV